MKPEISQSVLADAKTMSQNITDRFVPDEFIGMHIHSLNAAMDEVDAVLNMTNKKSTVEVLLEESVSAPDSVSMSDTDAFAANKYINQGSKL